MKRNFGAVPCLAVPAAVAATLAVSVFVVHAQPFDESEWPNYQQYCASPDNRVVFVEALEGRLAGYTNLVCLDEALQQTNKRLLDTNFQEVSADDLPAYVRPTLGNNLQATLADPAAAINQDQTATIDVYLTMRTLEPAFVPLPYSYALSGSSYSDGTQVISTATYYVENEQVSQEVYEAYVAEARVAEDARQAEIQQSIEEQAKLGFLTLVDVAGLAPSLNVAEINEDSSVRGYWWTNDTLSLSLTSAEINRMVETGAERFYMEQVGDSFDQGIELDGILEADQPFDDEPLMLTDTTESAPNVLASQNTTALADVVVTAQADNTDEADGAAVSNPFSDAEDGADVSAQSFAEPGTLTRGGSGSLSLACLLLGLIAGLRRWLPKGRV